MIRMLFVLSLSTSSSATSWCTRVSLPISRTRIYLSHLHTNHHCEHTHAHARTLVHTRAPRTHAHYSVSFSVLPAKIWFSCELFWIVEISDRLGENPTMQMGPNNHCCDQNSFKALQRKIEIKMYFFRKLQSQHWLRKASSFLLVHFVGRIKKRQIFASYQAL